MAGRPWTQAKKSLRKKEFRLRAGNLTRANREEVLIYELELPEAR